VASELTGNVIDSNKLVKVKIWLAIRLVQKLSEISVLYFFILDYAVFGSESAKWLIVLL
jgi:hypothetical protein